MEVNLFAYSHIATPELVSSDVLTTSITERLKKVNNTDDDDDDDDDDDHNNNNNNNNNNNE